jgi:hypothetical protein
MFFVGRVRVNLRLGMGLAPPAVWNPHIGEKPLSFNLFRKG